MMERHEIIPFMLGIRLEAATYPATVQDRTGKGWPNDRTSPLRSMACTSPLFPFLNIMNLPLTPMTSPKCIPGNTSMTGVETGNSFIGYLSGTEAYLRSPG